MSFGCDSSRSILTRGEYLPDNPSSFVRGVFFLEHTSDPVILFADGSATLGGVGSRSLFGLRLWTSSQNVVSN